MTIAALETLAETEAALAAQFNAGTITEVELAGGLAAAYSAAFGGASTPLEAALLAQQAMSRLTGFVDEFLGNVGLKPSALDSVDDLPATGNAIGDSFVIDSDLWVWAGSTEGWKNAGPIVGPAGKSVELRKTATHVQWRLVGAADWINLVSLADLKGADGREIELRATATHIQWHLGTAEWSDLIALADLKGADGREVEFHKSATHLQWRYVGAADWLDLLALADVTPEAVPGPAAWTPVEAVVADGARRVRQIVDWFGGDGPKPETGMFIGPDGWVETAAEATDQRGPGGSGSGDMVAANNLSELTDKEVARTALSVYSKAEADTTAGTKADLVGGKVPAAQLPALAITDVFEVATQAAMLALSAERGDVAIRTDENRSYVLAAEPATTLANWKLLRTPTDVVLSVAGETGAITAAALKAALAYGIADVSGLSAALLAKLDASAKASAAQIRAGVDDTAFATAKGILDSVAWVAVAASGGFSLDLATGINFDITLNANATFNVPANMTPGMSGFIIYRQPAVGGKTLARHTSVKVKGGTMFTVSTGNNAVDIGSYLVLPDGSMSLSDIDKAVA